MVKVIVVGLLAAGLFATTFLVFVAMLSPKLTEEIADPGWMEVHTSRRSQVGAPFLDAQDYR
jgi:hypothetical protein